MNKGKNIFILFILLLIPFIAHGERQDSLIVSLVTCWPGAEVYELCGHEAVRVRGIAPEGHEIDSVWNYGTFDFNQPNFVYRFVKGETDYQLSSYPFAWFMPEYVNNGRRVEEQDLSLSRDEVIRLLGVLRHEALPENRVYRYNYVKDNCATRILERLDEATKTPVVYPDSISYGSFREEMRSYHRDYPWYQFGIDLALGSGIDYPLRGREEMFVPVEMHRKTGKAHFADGRPFVASTRTLNEGLADATSGATPFFLTPIFLGWIWFALVTVSICLMYRRNTVWRWLYSLWFTLTGLTGCILAFLIFISEHEATSPNLLFLWLNPLQLVIGAGVWFRSWRPAVIAMAVCNVVLIILMLIVWPWQPQSANPALFPMMGSSLLLSAYYAIISRKISYLKV